MWFKNLKLYRLAPNSALTAATLEEALEPLAFQPGGSQDSQVSGWVSPRDDGALAYEQNGQILLRLRTEKKLLPNSVINQASRARAQEIEDRQGYKPGRKQMKEIKEQMTMELLPKAFVTQSDTHAWFDTKNGRFVVDASSANKSDEVLGMLAKSLTPFPIIPLHVEMSPARAMTQWLAEDEPPEGFTTDQDTQLQSTGESRATVRWTRESVNISEALDHIKAGKQCTHLAMTWNDRISFVLADDLSIKKVEPLDVLKESDDQPANETETFEADFTLMTGELARMLGGLTAALGGMLEAA